MEIYIISGLLTFTVLTLMSYLYSRFVTNKLAYQLTAKQNRLIAIKTKTKQIEAIQELDKQIDIAEQAFFEAM